MKDQGDVSNLSAFAVYNQLIPGVKSYTENSESNSKRRKRKNKNKTGMDSEKVETTPAVTLKSGPKNAKDREKQKYGILNIQESPENPITAEQSSKKKRKRKKNKDKGQVENGEVSYSLNPPNPKIAKLDPNQKKKEKNGLPMLLPNPLAVSPTKLKKSRPTVNTEKDNVQGVHHINEEPTHVSSVGRNKKRQKLSSNSSPTSIPHAVENDVENEDFGLNNSIASLFTSKPVWDSVDHGKSLLEWLIYPTSVDTFMSEYWEKKPLHIKRNEKGADYYKWILSSEKIDDILRRNVLKYQKNIDITSYSKSNNVRETQSDELEGRARPAVVWDYYNNGCSIRILNPQTYIKQLWRLNASLQEWFGSFVGANVYLTPPDSQGFAPHYDDIEAFIIQVEGKKHWKLYKPRSKNEELPRFSSNNFSEEKDNLGKPILDVVVEEGDLLYFPRGTIHQAMASEDVHSLHITLSCHQKNSWGDLLKEHLNNVIDKAMASDVEFRKGLPTDYLGYMGIAHQDNHDNDVREKRKKFGKTVKRLMDKLSSNAADFAADQMGKKFIWDSLPPYLSSKEKSVTVNEDGEFIQFGAVFNRCEMDPDVEVKLVRKNCIRLVVEEGCVRSYFTTENSMVYHEEEPQYLELSAKTAPAVQYLISSYPEYVKIDDLPISADDVSEKVQVAADLWERGLLMTRTPLETADGDDGEFDSEDAESIGDEEELEEQDIEEVSDMDEDNFFGDSDPSDDSDDDEEDIDSPFNESNEDSEEEIPVPILVKKKAKK